MVTVNTSSDSSSNHPLHGASRPLSWSVRTVGRYVLFVVGLALVSVRTWKSTLSLEPQKRETFTDLKKNLYVLADTDDDVDPLAVPNSGGLTRNSEGVLIFRGGKNYYEDMELLDEKEAPSWNDEDDTHELEGPKIAWLMSFPNSGTSYTMTMVARTSNRTTATNYGREVTEKPIPNTPLYKNHYEGPFYKPNGRSLPEEYIMVKTHCGGRCVKCAPEDYLITEDEFAEECTRGSGLQPHHRTFDIVHYPISRVKRAIHLIRNPFDNVVSRFHLEHKHFVLKQKTDMLELYPNSADGFQAWCRHINDEFGMEGLPEDVQAKMETIPCHGEIYRFAQWHNHVNEIATMPKLTVHYENYEQDWNGTVDKILSFLDLELLVPDASVSFSARHDYDPYFTTEQRAAAADLLHDIASEETWNQIQHYMQ